MMGGHAKATMTTRKGKNAALLSISGVAQQCKEETVGGGVF